MTIETVEPEMVEASAEQKPATVIGYTNSPATVEWMRANKAERQLVKTTNEIQTILDWVQDKRVPADETAFWFSTILAVYDHNLADIAAWSPGKGRTCA